jgi:hypothetical protein
LPAAITSGAMYSAAQLMIEFEFMRSGTQQA